ncbi:hypothetical protein ACFVYG_34180 [Streptomyces sp. NPDC058256]|uniref:hypothetical protein n=1 Tax=Streptomyces sp. NPDC058256 TaxID=3346408 RepID=UPI0036EB04EE
MVPAVLLLIGSVIPSAWGWAGDAIADPPGLKVASPGPGGCGARYSASTGAELKGGQANLETGIPVVAEKFEDVSMPITMQALTDQAIVVTGMTLNALSSKAVPRHGSIVDGEGCGGGIDERLYGVTLPTVPSSVQPQIVGKRENGVTFPYKVTSDDPEVLTVRLNPVDRDVRFTVTVDWVSEGEIGSTTLDNKPDGSDSRNGSGYRVMGAGNLPVYELSDLYG